MWRNTVLFPPSVFDFFYLVVDGSWIVASTSDVHKKKES